MSNVTGTFAGNGVSDTYRHTGGVISYFARFAAGTGTVTPQWCETDSGNDADWVDDADMPAITSSGKNHTASALGGLYYRLKASGTAGNPSIPYGLGRNVA